MLCKRRRFLSGRDWRDGFIPSELYRSRDLSVLSCHFHALYMTLIKLVRESFIDISHSSKTSLLYIDWKGYQSIESIHRGCEHILDVLRQTGAGSIFNDNTHLLGIWNDAAQWVPEVAGNAAAGLEIARHFVPDLIFCDIGLLADSLNVFRRLVLRQP